MRSLTACGIAIGFLLGCGGDADSESEEEPQAHKAAAQQKSPSPGAEDLWAPFEPKEPVAPLPARDPRVPLDADAVIARFEKECAGNASGTECRAQRRDLELVFFADLLGLRSGGQRLDRELARAAARAQLPQLACFGLRELLWGSELSPEDERLIREALDSPWRAPREIARSFGYRRAVPVSGLSDLFERNIKQPFGSSAHLCLDGARDPEPNPGLAGNYPGARFRPFASKEDLMWFTTRDPAEKVLAVLTRGGKHALTAMELKAAQQANYMDEMLRLSSGDADPDAPDATARMMELAFGASVDWTAPFDSIERAGEVRYVMITPKQAVAVFRDDALNATSIVAPRPPPAPLFDPAAFGL